MAGRKFIANTGPVQLAASTTLTVVGVIAPATCGIVLTAMEISFEGGGAATEKAVKVEYCTWSADGTGTSITVSNADRQDDGSPGTTAKKNYSGAPSTGEIVLRTEYVDANKGNDSFPGAIRLKAGEIFGIRVTGPAGLTTTNVNVFIGGDE